MLGASFLIKRHSCLRRDCIHEVGPAGWLYAHPYTRHKDSIADVSTSICTEGLLRNPRQPLPSNSVRSASLVVEVPVGLGLVPIKKRLLRIQLGLAMVNLS